MTGRPTDRIEHLTPEERRFPANMSFNGKDDYRFTADNLPIFPITIWVVPDVSRKQKLIDGIADQLGKAARMFLVITLEELPSTILNGAG